MLVYTSTVYIHLGYIHEQMAKNQKKSGLHLVHVPFGAGAVGGRDKIKTTRWVSIVSSLVEDRGVMITRKAG